MQALSRNFSRLASFTRYFTTSSSTSAIVKPFDGRHSVNDKPEVRADPASKIGLTPSRYASYRRRIATRKGWGNVTENQWDEWERSRVARSRRLRGVVIKKDPAGKEVPTVVGQRVYLPNIICRLVRNNTPPGQPYNPYEATFRIPKSVTKTDVRSYLLAVYGVKTTYVHTDIYESKLYRSMHDGSKSVTYSNKTYKRAIVGLVDPFIYPLAIEDMSADERTARTEWVEENFQIERVRRLQRIEILRMSKKGSVDWRWRGHTSTSKKAILKRVAERRLERDTLLKKQVAVMQHKRAAGELVFTDRTKHIQATKLL